jgi:hypothetical protein
MLIGAVVGIRFINEPKLIYFSDPVNEPRDEWWAGLLLGAVALLACIRIVQATLFWSPARFAAYGAIGGGVGFGGGCLLLAMQTRVAESWRWMPYWKYMEFTFGLLFGAALGLCALHLRHRLSPLGTRDGSQNPIETFDADWRSVFGWIVSLAAAVPVVFGAVYGWRYLAIELYPLLRNLQLGGLERTAMRVLFGFMGTGCVLMLLSRRWQTAGWQTAISVTILAAAHDWQDRLLERGNIDMPQFYRRAFLLGMAAISILFVQVWQHRKAPKLMDAPHLYAAVCNQRLGGRQRTSGRCGPRLTNAQRARRGELNILQYL